MSLNPESANAKTQKKSSGLKVLGLSCGSRNGNSEILLKEAIMGAMGHGVETAEIIRLLDFHIKPCIGCQTCVMSAMRKETPRCVIKDDDVPLLLEKLLVEDCALIVTAPIYFWTPPGLLKVVHDRFTPYTVGQPELMYNPRRIGASISVGGEAKWTAMALPLINHFLLPHRIIVDQFQVSDAGISGQVIRNEKALQRARKLGENVAASMKGSIEEVQFMGDEGNVSCPKCHSNILIVPKGLPEAVCPICDIKAKVIGSIRVFSG